MRKIFVLTALAVLILGACKKKDITPDNQGKDPEVEEVKDDLDFKLGFVDSKKISNLLINMPILFNIEITDTAPEPNILYRLKPIGNEVTKHQKFKKDYTLKSFNNHWTHIGEILKDADQIEVKDISDSPKLAIVPKVPGTFQLYFEMQKYDTVQKKNIGKPVVRPIAFSAVDIQFLFPVKQVGWKTKLGTKKDKYQRFFVFKIYDGDKENDKYLSDKVTVSKYTYFTRQSDGAEFKGDFVASKAKGPHHEMEFRHSVVWENQHPDLASFPQTVDITIYKHNEKGEVTQTIKYEDVALKY